MPFPLYPAPMILTGRHIRLEPLSLGHVEALSAASAADPSLCDDSIYNFTVVPQGIEETTLYIQTALDWQNAGTAVPFIVIRNTDNAIIGTTRYWNIERWLWPPAHTRHGNPHPDVCEIGWTWYTRSAIRSGANIEAKFLMLAHAFEVWTALRVCLHTDSRNLRSQTSMERIGFKREGVLRAHKLAVDNIPRDSIRFSMIAAEWPAAKQRIAERIQRRT
ncbi:MAG TPA: GNAT family protein [Silvibacterium sp.]|nr:GNAT family protein [Silvibacterium sp.]